MNGSLPGRYGVAALVFACILLAPLSGFGQGQALHSFRNLWENFPNLGEKARKEALVRIRASETEYYQNLELAKLHSQENLEGCDPYRIAPLGANRYAVLLRGADQVLLIDQEGNVLDRASAPDSPTSLVYWGETLLVGSESSPVLMRFVPGRDKLGTGERFSVPDVMGLRDLEMTPEGQLFGCDEITNQIFEIQFPLQKTADLRQQFKVGPGPVDLAFKNNRLYVNSLVSHQVRLFELDTKGQLIDAGTHLQHDGPVWSMRPLRLDGRDYLVLGGVENTPLDRTQGFFGNIDSFLFLYEINESKARLVSELNVSALGVITPKWIGVSHSSPSTILVSGYGSATLLELEVSRNTLQVKEQRASFPAVQEFTHHEDGTWIGVSPLLDGVVIFGDSAPRFASLQDSRDNLFVLGESLFFTELMAPRNSSLGKKSRFTCETCHFEGMIDGRTHFTGRGEVHAVTKP
ncbi:MAG: hypothetical protein HKN21_15625, partial [Candidatus Eisenbacteria bacterium]|nr:hypothetical protein [Candidatus Eisenbacteria bacterium]